MSEENVELTRRAFDAFNRRDLEGFLALMDENVTADSRLAFMEGGYRGHDGIRRLWRNLDEAIPDLSMDIVEVRDLGDDLTLAVVRQRAHGAESGAPVEETTWMPGRWRRGKCVWWATFMSEADALEAAGLPG